MTQKRFSISFLLCSSELRTRLFQTNAEIDQDLLPLADLGGTIILPIS